jgi:hypothetical protein
MDLIEKKAIERMNSALSTLRISGIPTSIPLAILDWLCGAH